MLIVYFSWSGNTQGVAQEIQRQTGADIFEIIPIPAYSDDYNTVLMEAQRDQHEQARPAITNPPQSIDEYDVILLGYPNWWASIPMPIATFLESYDFSGKTVYPFDTHAGSGLAGTVGSISQTIPGADVKEGLAVAGTEVQNNPESARAAAVSWLKENGLIGE